MSLAERLSSKFQVFLLASLLGRIFIFRSISQLWTLPAARKGLFTKLGRYETRGHWFWLWQVVLYQCVALPQSPSSILYYHRVSGMNKIDVEGRLCPAETFSKKRCKVITSFLSIKVTMLISLIERRS